MPSIRRAVIRLAAPVLALGLAAAGGGVAVAEFPTTEFGDGATQATVSDGRVSATVALERRPSVDPDFETPVLTVSVDGRTVLEAEGFASGFDFPATEASIAEIDPGNATPEVYFTSYGGGAHCCTLVIVATAVGDRWKAVEVGEFDGDARYLTDVDGDGLAEISTIDNAFLYQFGCYACSAAPLVMLTVRDGALRDISADPRFLPAHRKWLDELEADIDSSERWTSPGFLAGWVAAKIRVGEGDEAWAALESNWDFAGDPGEEVCLTGQDIADCPKRSRVVLSFPERLKLFLQQNGYMP